MIYLGYHQFTYRCIIICCLIFNFVLMIQANQVQCRIPYNLKIQDEQITYRKFTKLKMSSYVKVIFFQMHVGNSSYIKDHDDLYFAWVKNNFGITVFTLPISYMVMSLELYQIFTNTLKITLIDTTQGCFNDSNDESRQEIIFKTLIDFTQVNYTCHDNNCSTICKRFISKNDKKFNKKIQASCCQRDILNPQINISQCSDGRVRPVLAKMQTFLLLVVSLCLAGIALNKIFNWFLTSIQR